MNRESPESDENIEEQPDRADIRQMFFGFFIGVMLFLSAIHLIEETGCIRCHGSGFVTSDAGRVSWAGSDFGVLCHSCDGEGKNRRIWFYLGDDR